MWDVSPPPYGQETLVQLGNSTSYRKGPTRITLNIGAKFVQDSEDSKIKECTSMFQAVGEPRERVGVGVRGGVEGESVEDGRVGENER